MKYIRKIKLFNFKRFKEFSVTLDPTMNIIIGDNEAGKSTIIQAIDIALSGSRSKVETQGIDKLLNIDAVKEFMCGEKRIDLLPRMVIELYFSEMNSPLCNGENNSDNVECDGISLIFEPSDEYSNEIKDVLDSDDCCFPYEYYTIRFISFSGEYYTGYRKFLKHILIDNSSVNGDYATKEYIKAVYYKSVNNLEKAYHSNEYRKSKANYKSGILVSLNDRLGSYEFDIRTDTKSNLISDLTINEGDIPIENKGKGRQCFVKTEFALQRTTSGNDIEVLLLEEPENHLSHINMKLLINHIANSDNKQVFITTHNSLICSRLDLRKTIIINSASDVPIKLASLPSVTAEFFIKAPNNNILEFVLSSKVLLVEGDAEYILMDAFFKRITGNELANSGVHIISVGGTSFKRYLDISKLLNIKTAVVRDNDGNVQANCVESYSDYQGPNMKLFYESDNTFKTFEVSIFVLNTEICNKLFASGRRTLTVQDYMLNNKTETAYQLLKEKSNEIIVPEYIQEAILWING
ncbi:ATP-dependent endonuclease [Sporomusa aerivorans]|uniref:ATP-dependent nuclease n=1 Tax=Sporomusa aerivorans TaxID=204936 RepID=UPI00352B7F96